MAKKLGWFGERFCLLCAVLFSGVILLQALFTAVRGGKYVIAFLGGAAAMGALLFLGRRFLTPFRGFPVLLFALRFVLAMGVILLFGAQPVQDFQTMYNAGCQIASGSREYLSDAYFYNWAYQTGFAAYEAGIIRLFGTGLLPLQTANALWMAGTGCMVYAIGRRFLTEKGAMLASLFYALYPAPYFLSAVLTNQHIATFFYYLGIWLLIRGERLSFPRALLAGAAIAVGNVMRPLGVVVVLAFLCWGAVRLLLWKGPGALREAGAIALAAAAYYGVFALLAQLVVLSGLNPEGLANHLPLWKFVIGLNFPYSGGWNRADYEQYYFLPRDRVEEAMRQAIGERLGIGPFNLLRLAWGKSQTMWGSPESMNWGFAHLDGNAPVLGGFTVAQLLQAVNFGDRGVFVLAFGLALAALAVRLRKGSGEDPRTFLLLSFLLCGYYAAHLIVEVQPRYRYFLMPAVFLLAGAGLELQPRRFLALFRRGKEKGLSKSEK